jgi:hypothetical protein
MPERKFSTSHKMTMEINTFTCMSTLTSPGAGRLWSEIVQHKQLPKSFELAATHCERYMFRV